MPEYPDIMTYLSALRPRVVGQVLQNVLVKSPFLVRSHDPPLRTAVGKRITGLRRMGKRIVFELEDDLFLVLHLMIAGRLHWRPAGAKVAGKIGLAVFSFADGSLSLTEASTQKRASLHLVRGEAGLEPFQRGGAEVFESSDAELVRVLRSENHTLKRSLTDPTLFSGIGNAYSDEILHAAQLSPVKLTSALSDEEAKRLVRAMREVLQTWTERLQAEAEVKFPEKVTAFRPEMAVHGKYKQPCPRCGQPVQRIVHAANETNYCAHCQTGGKLLADRSLSRLLKKDWPKTLDELEELKSVNRAKGAIAAKSDGG